MKLNKKMIYPILYAFLLLLVVGVLALDVWVYVRYASFNPSEAEIRDLEKVFLFNTPKLVRVAETISEKKNFLQNPTFPLINDPF